MYRIILLAFVSLITLSCPLQASGQADGDQVVDPFAKATGLDMRGMFENSDEQLAWLERAVDATSDRIAEETLRVGIAALLANVLEKHTTPHQGEPKLSNLLEEISLRLGKFSAKETRKAVKNIPCLLLRVVTTGLSASSSLDRLEALRHDDCEQALIKDDWDQIEFSYVQLLFQQAIQGVVRLGTFGPQEMAQYSVASELAYSRIRMSEKLISTFRNLALLGNAAGHVIRALDSIPGYEQEGHERELIAGRINPLQATHDERLVQILTRLPFVMHVLEYTKPCGLRYMDVIDFDREQLERVRRGYYLIDRLNWSTIVLQHVPLCVKSAFKRHKPDEDEIERLSGQVALSDDERIHYMNSLITSFRLSNAKLLQLSQTHPEDFIRDYLESHVDSHTDDGD